MKNIKRIVAAVTLFAFSISSIPSYALETNPSTSASTLAPFTKFLPHEGTEFKDVAQIRLGILKGVKDLTALNADTVRALGVIKFSEKSRFGGRVRGTIYFNETSEVGIEARNVSIENGNYLFRTVTKAGITYYCLISKNADAPGVNISIASERVLAKALETGAVKFTHASPDRKDKEVVELYLDHEVTTENNEATDPFIAKNMAAGNYAVSDRFAANPLYSHPKRKVYYSGNYRELLARIEIFLRAIGTPEDNIEAIMRDKSSLPLILIPYKDAGELPAEEIGGKGVKVYGHSSVLGRYAFIPQELFDRAMGPGKWDTDAADAIEDIDEHETGAGCGKKAALKNGRVQNVLDEYFALYKAAGRPKTFEVPQSVREELKTLAPVNLLELELRNDYAAGKAEEGVLKRMFSRNIRHLLTILGVVAVGGAVTYGTYNKAKEPEKQATIAKPQPSIPETAPKQAPLTPDQSKKIEELIRKSKDEDKSVRLSAARDLVEIGQVAVPALIKALGDENLKVRYSAAFTLGNIGPAAKDTIQALAKALSDENWEIRSSAAEALGNIGPAAKDAIPALIKTLGDDDWGVRGSAYEALGKIGKAAIPALIKTLGDEKWMVGESAAKALGNIGPDAKDAVPALIKTLGDENWGTNIFAIEALGKIGSAAKEAIPILQRFTEKNVNKDVRGFAQAAIEKIEGARPSGSSEAEGEVSEVLWRVGNKDITPLDAKGRLAELLPGVGANPRERDAIFDEMLKQSAATMTALIMAGGSLRGSKYAAPSDDDARLVAARIKGAGIHVFMPQSRFPNDTAKKYKGALETTGNFLRIYNSAEDVGTMMTGIDPKKCVVMTVGLNDIDAKAFEALKAKYGGLKFLNFAEIEDVKDLGDMSAEELDNYVTEMFSILLPAGVITPEESMDEGSPMYRLLAYLLEDYMPAGVTVNSYIKDVAVGAVSLIKTILRALPATAYRIIRPAIDTLWSV